MRRENQTMVDKIPWDTCVIALIFYVDEFAPGCSFGTCEKKPQM